MSQELQDFEHFKEHQLTNFDTVTGQLDVKTRGNRWFKDVGSANEDGYIRLWANGKLRMKHRLVYFLTHGRLPMPGNEVDHINSIRNDNRPNNLQELNKTMNNTRKTSTWSGKQFSKEQVIEVCELLANSSMSDLDISKLSGFSRATVRDIKTRKKRTSISCNYVWPHRVK